MVGWLVVLTLQTTIPAAAAERIEFVPREATGVEVGGHRYGGTVAVASRADGLVVTERLGVDRYLLGIREVPFGWPEEALKAQAIAARTYLAWTLQRGRSNPGRRYGYDICATSACQVYVGMEAVNGPLGERWRRAVEETAGLILVYRGRPAQALYSSTSGGRTRSVEDVFPGSPPVPYLRAVDSPGEQSPFAWWAFRLDADQMEALLEEAGLLRGRLLDIKTNPTDDGGGPWTVEITGSGGVVSVSTWELRGALNRAAATLMPDLLPARRLDGSGLRYPQTILSPTYTIQRETWWVIADGPPRVETRYLVAGRGWGHLVGMSQYGAEAMARGGSSAGEILAHYYGGLRPVRAGRLLPDQVTVGLEVGAERVEVRPLGPVTVKIDGRTVAEDVLGSWSLGFDGGELVAVPPEGLGEAPELVGPLVFPRGRGTADVGVRLTAPAELRIVVTVEGRRMYDSGWMLRDAGEVSLPWEGGKRRVAVEFTARNPQGSAALSSRLPTNVD